MAGINIFSSRVRGRRVFPNNEFIAGMSRYDKGGDGSGSFYVSRGADYRSNPREVKLQPASVKESGSNVVGLPMWVEHVGTNLFYIDNKGNIYQRTSAGSHSLLHTTANSLGNGLGYYGEDDYLYYPNNTTLGRYGPMSSSPQTFVDDYFGSQGGVPTNTAQLNLVAASSQYVKHADGAAYDITSDIAMEIYATPASLPTVGNSMTLMGKWDENANHRSYKLDIYSISGFFGNGGDGSLTVSVNSTQAPIDSACSGTAGSTTLTATNASFAAGQIIYIFQMQGTGAGAYERNIINGYTAGTITLASPLVNSYSGVAQVIVCKQYTNVTVNGGVTWTAKAWNGTTGGILAFLANGTVTVTGSINATGANSTTGGTVNGGGFRGGSTGSDSSQYGQAGEGTVGAGPTNVNNLANGNGGGAGLQAFEGGNGGGGGGNGTSGVNGGTQVANAGSGIGGNSSGSSDLTTMTFGGGGGTGGRASTNNGAGGGNGGGIIYVLGTNLIVSGSIVSNGGNGSTTSGNEGSGGGGGGGSILLKAQTATLGASLITASGGTSVTPGGSGLQGGNGGGGRITIDYLTSYTGTTNPTLTAIQDNTLVTTVTQQLRFGVSNDGTAFEYLSINATIPLTPVRYGVSWKASTSIATFYSSGLNLGSIVGTKTSISNNVSEFAVGANKGASAYQNFFDGQLDDARLWNTTRTDTQMLVNNNVELNGTEVGLASYYKFNSALTDATSNANTLTNVNTATYNIYPPFPSPTTRLDIDQSYTQTQVGTYTLPTSLTEADKQSFVPAKDPQKSLDVDIAAKGTGNWTLVVHNGLNQLVAQVTVTNANLPTSGFYEFVYSTAFRPVVGATYHFHLYSTVNDGTANTHVNADPTTIRFHSYYQFLVNDTYHPAMQISNVLAIGNERYLAVQDASAGYNNMRLKLPSGWHIRCLGKWRNKLMIGCWKGTNITDFDQGIIFIWNGYSVTYEDFIEVPQGGINAMVGVGDTLYFVAGYQGMLMKYDGTTKPQQLRQIPKMNVASTIEILPGAMTFWNKLLRIGVALNCTNGNVQRGVYSYGNNFDNETESFSLDHVISTGNYGSTVKVGALLPATSKLFIGWGDGAAYGMDVVNPAGNPTTSATIEGNITDFGMRWKDKQAYVVRADFKPLLTGENINIKYRFGYDQAWVLGDLTKQLVGDTVIRLNVAAPTGNHHEFQLAVDLSQTNNTSPTLLEYGIDEDLLVSESENPY